MGGPSLALTEIRTSSSLRSVFEQCGRAIAAYHDVKTAGRQVAKVRAPTMVHLISRGAQGRGPHSIANHLFETGADIRTAKEFLEFQHHDDLHPWSQSR